MQPFKHSLILSSPDEKILQFLRLRRNVSYIAGTAPSNYYQSFEIILPPLYVELTKTSARTVQDNANLAHAARIDSKRASTTTTTTTTTTASATVEKERTKRNDVDKKR